MRVPQAPQKAKPGGTGRPQFGQLEPSGAATGAGATAGAVAAPTDDERAPNQPAATSVDAAGMATGAGVGDAANEPAATPPPADDPGATTEGIFGESFQGIPLFGLAAGKGVVAPAGGVSAAAGLTATGAGVGSPAIAEARGAGSGGRIVRAVSTGSGSREAAFGAAFISFPQPRQNL